jgi:small-conductance mechanosensitive channel
LKKGAIIRVEKLLGKKMRLTIDEYSQKFKMSKEMINSKIKTDKLSCVVEDGVTYIIPALSEFQAGDQPENIKIEVEVQKAPPPAKKRTTVATILALYQRENQHLKEKIIKLEEKIDKLIDDKEQMLRDERDKIEELYTTKDEQLKNILELVNAKMMMQAQPQTIHEVESFSSQENKELTEPSSEIVELRAYLKTLDLKSHQRKVIKKRFLAVYDSDVRIKQQNGKLYLDFSKYDYSDLLEY